jgi:hypothetical protein
MRVYNVCIVVPRSGVHTPDYPPEPELAEDDQPYAGILYVDNVLYVRKERWAHTWQLKLGVVGVIACR